MICNLKLKKQKKFSIFSLALFLWLVLSAVTSNLNAQITVRGTVLDQAGEAIVGASVLQKGTTNGVATDATGSFQLNVPGNATLVISYLGYEKKEVAVNNQTNLTIRMSEDSKVLGEVVVVGYGTQAKATLAGAIASARGDDIIKTKNENIQNMITGRIPGVRVRQKTAEPGAYNTNMNIRGLGNPLIVINDVPRTMEAFQRLNPYDIESISVLKDASAAIYGVRSANGVVLVNTKEGTDGVIRMDYSGHVKAEVPYGLPATLDAIGYMTLRNERNMHNVGGGTRPFGDAHFEPYLNGTKESVDWYSHVFSQYAPSTQHSLNARGGTDKIKFYAGVGYLYQDGFFKKSDLDYSRYNAVANVSGKITDNLTVKMNINLMSDQQNRPFQDSWWIIRGFWRQNPLIPVYADPEQTMLYHGLIEGDNPLSFMSKDVCGYKTYKMKTAEITGILEYKIPGIKGLTATGKLSYNYYTRDSKEFQKEYNQYRYNEAQKTYEKFTRQSPTYVYQGINMQSQIMSHLSLKYKREFLKQHKVEALIGWETNRYEGDNFAARRNLIVPLEYLFAGVSAEQQGTQNRNQLYINANKALLGRAVYNFSDRYIVEGVFRYDGSSKFAPAKQWGFFPGILGAWRISEEPFFQDLQLSFIQQLKLRASYGTGGDDSALAYQFLSGYNYPSSTDRRNFTGGYVFGGNFIASADNTGIPNPFITWYTAKSTNFGIDLDAFNKIGLTVEYFENRLTGELASRSGGIPTVVGAALPQENINSRNRFGMEMNLYWRDAINDFRYTVEGMAQITRTKRLFVETAAIGSSWNNWRDNQNNRLQGVHRGYKGMGQFQSWEQIWSHPVYIGRGTLPGDYYYEDWNGDGEINGNDSYPIRFNQDPWMSYSLTLGAAYKNFDLDLMFFGATMASLIYGEQLREPLWGHGESSAMAQFMDRWHPEDPKADPYDPAIKWIPGHFAYTGTLPDVNSSFNAEDGTYLRLRSIELGYTLPKFKGINEVRIFCNALNLFTLAKIKYVDPEHPDDTYGYLYPMNKSFSLGLNIRF